MRKLLIAFLTIMGLCQNLAAAGNSDSCEANLDLQEKVIQKAIERLRIRSVEVSLRGDEKKGIRLAIESLESSKNMDGAWGGIAGLNRAAAYFMEVEEDSTFLSAVRAVAIGVLEGNVALTDASQERPVERRKIDASELGWIKKAVASLEIQQNNPSAAQDEMFGVQKVLDLQKKAFQHGLILALRILRAGHSFDYSLMELNGATRLVNYFIQIEKDRRKLDELVWIMRGILVGNSALIDARDDR